MDQKTSNPPITKSTSWQMFDDISPRYDFLNHLLSFGLDIHWRACFAKYLPEPTVGARRAVSLLKILDLATGTADVLISLFKNNNVAEGTGLDMADKMMALGRQKITAKGLEQKITLQHGDAHQIPFEDSTFDAATIAFGIRNMDNPKQVLREMHRVVSPGGRGLVLEFSLPRNPVIRCVHLFYLRQCVPLIGAIFSGHYRAYRYLNQTIETFACGEDFCVLMRKAGFVNVQTYPLLFGVATIYCGDKI